LTKITEAQIEADNKLENAQVETVLPAEKPTINEEIASACHYHLGFLSEQKHKEQIPDECMVCKDIIECMFRKNEQAI
jgi:hypothetical protein